MNWTVVIIVGLFLVVLLVFLIRRNIKDERQFEEQLKQDFHKTKDEEGDAEVDEVMK